MDTGVPGYGLGGGLATIMAAAAVGSTLPEQDAVLRGSMASQSLAGRLVEPSLPGDGAGPGDQQQRGHERQRRERQHREHHGDLGGADPHGGNACDVQVHHECCRERMPKEESYSRGRA